MNRKLGIIALFLIIVGFSSCELFDSLDDGLSNDEVVQGLKKSLEIGSDTAVKKLNVTDGYYNNLAVRIPLPDEAENLRKIITDNNLAKYISLDKEFNNLIKAINKAAEKAATDATPHFKKAITDMSLADGWDILNGKVPGGTKSTTAFDSTAATTYFKNKTYQGLVGVYSPYINTVLDKKYELGFSANEAWLTLTQNYNSIYDNLNSNMLTRYIITTYKLPSKFNTNLGEFCTGKALDGLFYMVGKEEKNIRKDPYKWAVDIIRKVFSSVKP